MMMLVLLLTALELCLALPPETISQECPAINFSHDWFEENGRYYVKFDPETSLPFDFVDLHISLQNQRGDHPIGSQSNYPMQRETRLGGHAFVAEIKDEAHRAVLRDQRTDVTLMYSFTYCVGIDGKPTDCDTASYSIILLTYFWREEVVVCPMECGLVATTIETPVTCWGSDNQQYPSSRCQQLPRIAPRLCPATDPCLVLGWRYSEVVCPQTCGLPATQVEAAGTCWGSDDQMYQDRMCGELSMQPSWCPATEPCLQTNWRFSEIECPMQCGMPETRLEVPMTCWGSDGMQHPQEMCSQSSRPRPVVCPATLKCVEYFWNSMDMMCPQSCGQPMSHQLPDAICMGSDGRAYEEIHCGHLPRPKAVTCPATEPCVTYDWRGSPVQCPMHCGLPAQQMEVAVACFGSDNQHYPNQMCQFKHKPPATICPMTHPCVTYNWIETPTPCPTSCGMPAQHFEGQAVCMGSDNQPYPDAMCFGMQRPPSTFCPATAPCMTYNWVETPTSCPTSCGMPAQQIEVQAVCMGSDNQQYPDMMCQSMQRPPPVFCPATVPCVTYSWVGAPPMCPTTCGMPAQQIETPATCMGSDNMQHSNEMCYNMPRPGPMFCPATNPCVVMSWRQGIIDCPTECGQPAMQLQEPSQCWGSDGQQYPTSACNSDLLPAPVFCPATTPCVIYAWEAYPVQCPSECGHGSSSVYPEAVCIGSDGRTYDDFQCSHLPRPAAVVCDATPPCVTYDWHVTHDVVCPTECGLPAMEVDVPTVCMASDGTLVSDHLCAHSYRPPAVTCPATMPCMSYNWRAGNVACPTTCGMPATFIAPSMSCVGSDGLEASGMCSANEAPEPVECPETPPCDVDCEVSDWSEWTGCSAQCGGGETSRFREIVVEPYGGLQCPELFDIVPCNSLPCVTRRPPRVFYEKQHFKHHKPKFGGKKQGFKHHGPPRFGNGPPRFGNGPPRLGHGIGHGNH